MIKLAKVKVTLDKTKPINSEFIVEEVGRLICTKQPKVRYNRNKDCFEMVLVLDQSSFELDFKN